MDTRWVIVLAMIGVMTLVVLQHFVVRVVRRSTSKDRFFATFGVEAPRSEKERKIASPWVGKKLKELKRRWDKAAELVLEEALGFPNPNDRFWQKLLEEEEVAEKAFKEAGKLARLYGLEFMGLNVKMEPGG